ncbi:hypothetical protein EZ313_20320 [Ramlibacter henchirensis]|uniref:Uncharacterized protein n=1 Tax=Ramlibacter henchirensis TaxID=204072 RepID=A0A4Z0BPU5_9BURK|nr:hypothetical protein [Ramlibacter henchirensis]TFZ00792.1 hypothetical protein EZ313_20320 [Ramlibacter henchirensis]
MFDKIKKAFAKDTGHELAGSGAQAAEWASRHGFAFSDQGGGFAIQGPVAGKTCRIEVGTPSRAYIQGDELRARVDLGTHPDVLLMVMNRPLRDSLEKQAYSMYTDTLQTSIGTSMPEEMRLLAMFEESGWDNMPRAFWTRYTLVADERANAVAWMDASLSQQLLEWPEPAPGADQPFVLILQRGRIYLRMQNGPAQPSLQHLVQVLSTAGENALRAFPVKA